MANHKARTHNGHNGHNGANQGEGDKASARKYNEKAMQFAGSNKVEQAAKEAKDFVDANPAEARADEEIAKAGPSPIRTRINELVTEGKAMLAKAKAKFQEMTNRQK